MCTVSSSPPLLLREHKRPIMKEEDDRQSEGTIAFEICIIKRLSVQMTNCEATNQERILPISDTAKNNGLDCIT